jgi:hypothetical protein
MQEHEIGLSLYLCETHTSKSSSSSEIDKDEFQEMENSDILLEGGIDPDNNINVV